MLINLLSNALKFTMKGKIRVDVNFDEEKRFLTLVVSDTGIGIRRIDQVKLFQMFGKLDTRHNPTGIGLGLNVCKRIVTCYGGNISLESELEKGSKFKFCIKVDDFNCDLNESSNIPVKKESFKKHYSAGFDRISSKLSE